MKTINDLIWTPEEEIEDEPLCSGTAVMCCHIAGGGPTGYEHLCGDVAQALALLALPGC